MEAAVFEVRVEELHAEAEKVLDEMRVGWQSWIDQEGEDAEQQSLYDAEEQKAATVLSDIVKLRSEEQNKLVSDQLSQCKETVTQIITEFKQLGTDNQNVEPEVLEIKAEKLETRTQEVLDGLQAQWSKWVEKELVDEIQSSLYLAEERRAKKVLSVVADLKTEKHKEIYTRELKIIKTRCQEFDKMQTRYNTILRKQKGESGEKLELASNAEGAVVKSDLAIIRRECSSILGSMKEFKRK